MARTQAPGAGGLDELDVAILRILTQHGDITNKALAQRLDIAESTCAHRVRSLKARGVIRDTRVRVEPDALGYPLQAMIRVRLTNHTPDGVHALADPREEKIETVAQRRREVGAVDSHWKPFRFWRTVSSHRR